MGTAQVATVSLLVALEASSTRIPLQCHCSESPEVSCHTQAEATTGDGDNDDAVVDLAAGSTMKTSSGKEKERDRLGRCASRDGNAALGVVIRPLKRGRHCCDHGKIGGTSATRGSGGKRPTDGGRHCHDHDQMGGTSVVGCSGVKRVDLNKKPVAIKCDSEDSSDSDFSGTDSEFDSMYSYEIESDGSEDDVDNVARLELDYPFKSYLDLWTCSANWGPTRFLAINAPSGNVYKVRMVRRSNYHALTTGWTLLVTAEGLRHGQRVRFEYDGDHLVLTTDVIIADDDEIGFGPALSSADVRPFKREDYFIEENKRMGHAVLMALGTVWRVGAPRTPMFVCTIRPSQEGAASMFFSEEYSKTLPKKETVALRLIGSLIIICGAIHRYEKGSKRITKGWDQFVLEHHIVVGDVLAFCFYRGPSVHELVICRA